MSGANTNVFRTVLTVMRKELRDISRDRRTLALALLLSPLLFPALILGMGTPVSYTHLDVYKRQTRRS